MKGIIAGNFDVIQPGYIVMFNEINEYVDQIHERRRPDISLAKSTLDWKPIVDLETGLQETINYFNQS